MGWTFTYKDQKQSVADFFKKEFSGPRHEVLDVAATLTAAYIAIKRPDGTVYAVVCLIKRVKDGQNFGYKDMDESMGPYAYDCPERILRVLTPTTDTNALHWRQACYARLEQRKHAAKVGDVIQFASPLTFTDGSVCSTFKLVKPGKHLYFQEWDTGKWYRIPSWQERPYVRASDEMLGQYQ